MIVFRDRDFTSDQDDIEMVKWNDASHIMAHITAHIPAGLVTAGATKMRFKTSTWSFADNPSTDAALLYDFSGPTIVEIDLIDTISAIVLPDEVGRTPGFIPILTDNSGTIIDFSTDHFVIYFSIITNPSK